MRPLVDESGGRQWTKTIGAVNGQNQCHRLTGAQKGPLAS
jgi:hypothetical protein